MVELQRAIMDRCATYARPGGVITYSVCSLSRAEGPQIVADLIASGFTRAAPPEGFPADALTPEGDLLTLPHRHGTDGFYAARLTR
jgi:16S rRNA (cytosine967-C5)-methyltransferase